MLLMALNACHGPNSAAAGNDGGGGDTLRLAATAAGVYALDTQHPLLQLPVVISKKAAGVHYYLRLSGVTLPAAPDGVYELYLTPQPPQSRAELTANGAGFLDVLNTYSLSSNELQGRQVDIDITKVISERIASSDSASLYLTILFSGNKDAGGQESRNAGKLRLTGASIYAVP